MDCRTGERVVHAMELSNQKGGLYVVDNRGDTDSSLGAGAGEQLHDGRVHPYFACGRTCRGRNQRHSGPKTLAANELPCGRDRRVSKTAR